METGVIKLPLDHINMTLRAARLGYFWSDDHQYFIRIRAGGPLFTVNLAPAHNGTESQTQNILSLV